MNQTTRLGRTEQELDDICNSAVERSKVEILAHVASGRVPSTVETFGDLHDYVDANCYGGLCDDDDAFWGQTGSERDLVMDLAADVQNAVHAWIGAGGITAGDVLLHDDPAGEPGHAPVSGDEPDDWSVCSVCDGRIVRVRR